MVTAVWSDDPEFYEVILGSKELLGHVFVKINASNTDLIIDKFNLSKFDNNSFTRSDRHKYICVIMENTNQALNKIKEIMNSI